MRRGFRAIARLTSEIESAVDWVRYRKRDPGPYRIVPYRGHGTGETLWVRGRVLSGKPIPRAREDDSAWRNLAHTLRRLETDEVPGAKGKALAANRDVALLSRELVRLDCHVPVAPDWDASRVGSMDHDRLAAEIPGAFKPDQYWNMENPTAHERTTGPELWRQTDGRLSRCNGHDEQRDQLGRPQHRCGDRQRVDHVLDALVRRQQAKGENQRAPFHTDAVLAPGEGDVRNPVRNDVDLLFVDAVHRPQKIGAAGRHDDQAVGKRRGYSIRPAALPRRSGAPQGAATPTPRTDKPAPVQPLRRAQSA